MAATSVMLWDGPEGEIMPYDHVPEADWSVNVCYCCFQTPIPATCTYCNCTAYLAEKFGNDSIVAPTTEAAPVVHNKTSSPYQEVENPAGGAVTSLIDLSTQPARASCGIEIFAGDDPHVVTWCRDFNDTLPPQMVEDVLNFDPSADFHTYKIAIDFEADEVVNLPGCEFNFDDNNPPIHAWTSLKVFQMTGGTDLNFLFNSFCKLHKNYNWWMTNLQCRDRYIFHGGFLGLDNISVVDRGCPPEGYTIKQADATTWMALFAISMVQIGIELIRHNFPSAVDIQKDLVRYLKDFLCISNQLNKDIDNGGMWNPEMTFYNDVLVDQLTEQNIPIQVRSLVGLLPLVACGTVNFSGIRCTEELKQVLQTDSIHVCGVIIVISIVGLLPLVACGTVIRCTEELKQVLRTDSIHIMKQSEEDTYFLTCVPPERITNLLQVLFDEEEFLSNFGIRSLSKIHSKDYILTLPVRKNTTENPETFSLTENFTLHYAPGEADSEMMGGNSNWRGPIWICANYILLDALEKIYSGLGSRLTIQHPAHQSRISLDLAVKDVCKRLVSMFLPDSTGARPLHGDYKQFTEDLWKDLILYYEYFHADSGRGCGASHQTGWTALITEILYKLYS
ncbi:Hypothetical predicted protein [Mytilus galloprovincialis]|uniref:Glycosyl hydrolase family 63 C-terminal domain-containing protein n=1 Tax=Mytilus galloprovincialis TaxID=29158 RepID=A0A8B6FXB0_MYTGA|nr:Hypothetical predicted protein [Mytilus galloprovincialis]